MVETSARLLRLSLLKTRRDWTGTELAARLGVTTRTVGNDIDRLRRLGYQVATSAVWKVLHQAGVDPAPRRWRTWPVIRSWTWLTVRGVAAESAYLARRYAKEGSGWAAAEFATQR